MSGEPSQSLPKPRRRCGGQPGVLILLNCLPKNNRKKLAIPWKNMIPGNL